MKVKRVRTLCKSVCERCHGLTAYPFGGSESLYSSLLQLIGATAEPSPKEQARCSRLRTAVEEGTGRHAFLMVTATCPQSAWCRRGRRGPERGRPSTASSHGPKVLQKRTPSWRTSISSRKTSVKSNCRETTAQKAGSS